MTNSQKKAIDKIISSDSAEKIENISELLGSLIITVKTFTGEYQVFTVGNHGGISAV